MNTFVKDAQAALKTALKEFGTYSFDDKGPYEVMEIEPLEKRLREFSPQDAATGLCQLAAKGDREERVAEYLANCLEDLPDADWEVFESGLDFGEFKKDVPAKKPVAIEFQRKLHGERK